MKDLMGIYRDIFDVSEGKKKSNFRRCFPRHKEPDFKKKIDILYEEYYSSNGSYDYDSDVYARVTADVVKGYTNHKDTLIMVFKEYNRFLSEKYGLQISITYPPIPVSNTFERLMFIAKFLQNEKHSVSEISDILWQSSRTIEADLAKLQGNDNDPLQVCGQKFVISDIDRSMGHVYFESTAHPFFLTCNLTQVIATLEGLRHMGEQSGFRGYAMSMARNIWRQLSDYGKERIFYVMENLLNEDPEWYKSLDSQDEFAYRTELECCMERDDILMYCMKDTRLKERLCNIEYQDGDKSVFYTDVRVTQYNESGWKVVIGGKEKKLDPRKILRCSFHKENMF